MATYAPLLNAAAFSAGTGGQIAETDPRVAPILNGVTAAARRYCGWHVAPVVTETVRLDARGGKVLILPTLRVVSITSITADDEALVADTGFEWSADGMVRRLDAHWPEKYRTVEVTFQHGFNPGDVADLVQVLQQAAARAAASPMGGTAHQVGPFAFQASRTPSGTAGGIALFEHERAVLDKYRRPGAA